MPSAYPRLTSRRHPVVTAYRSLAHRHRDDAAVLLDGAHVIDEALQSGIPLASVLVSRAFLDEPSPAHRALVERAASAGAAVWEASPAVLDAASPVRTTTGIVAVAKWTPAEPGATCRPAPALTLGLVDVQDPGNVGAVIRSAHALGATGVMAIDRTADPGAWKPLRGAMGSTFRVPVAQTSLEGGIAAARQAGLDIVATVAGGATPIDAADFRRPCLLLLGNEGAGLDDRALGRADRRVHIPMSPGVNSLNVAVTAAILLYEARRQRGGVAMRRRPDSGGRG